MVQKKKENIINVPNILALIRLLLVPVVVWLILSNRMIAALIVFVVACLTDVVDGYVARHYNLITQFGTFLDPLADKLMAVSVVVTFTFQGILPWFVMAILFLKELLMLIGGVVTVKRIKVVLPSNFFGKMAALAFNASVGACFLYEYLQPYCTWLVYLALAGSVASLLQYAIRNWRRVFPKKEG